MLIHARELRDRHGTTWSDEGVRTHGSGSVASIFDGASHGCQRLLPALALRLGGFLIAHRLHVRHGEVATTCTRTVRSHGRFAVAVATRGYRIELVPPVPVNVLPGRVHRASMKPGR